MTETAPDQPAAAAPNTSHDGVRERERSTISFPYGDLESAVKIATGVHRAGGTSCQWEQLAAELKLSPKGGGFRLVALTAKTFGLVVYDKESVQLTALGSRVCDSTQEAKAKADAFLEVPLYKALFERFKSATLPPPAALEKEMLSLGVAAKQTKKARRAFQRSAEQAGFFKHGPERLVLPSTGVSTGREAGHADATEDGNTGRSNGADGGGGRHDLIEGLIKSLPPERSEWSTADRYKWLKAAITIFDLIYENAESDRSLKIELADSAK